MAIFESNTFHTELGNQRQLRHLYYYRLTLLPNLLNLMKSLSYIFKFIETFPNIYDFEHL